ncbi:protein of unknown function, partial [Taphrina deformans PYCC 5710]
MSVLEDFEHRCGMHLNGLRKCKLQTLGQRQYFEVHPEATAAALPLQSNSVASADFLAKQLQLTQEMNRATLEAEETVEAERAGNGKRLPWLEHLGLSVHLHGLARHKIVSSYGKPSPLEPGYKVMVALGEISTAILEETLKWCQDGRDCRMTRPMAVSLTQFAQAHKEVDGKFRGFYTKLEPATVKKYFAQWQGLLYYYYRVTKGLALVNDS